MIQNRIAETVYTRNRRKSSHKKGGFGAWGNTQTDENEVEKSISKSISKKGVTRANLERRYNVNDQGVLTGVGGKEHATGEGGKAKS